MYLVDTNVVSDAQRRRPQVVKWLRSVDPAKIYLSVITLGEIHRGVVYQRIRDRAAASALSVWFQTLRDNYRGRTLLVTEAVAIEWGRISAGPITRYRRQPHRRDCYHSSTDRGDA